MKLFDTHFHLDLTKDPISLIEKIEKLKIYTIAVTNLPSLFPHTADLVSKCKYIRPSLGFHPELVHEHLDEMDKFKQLILKTRYIGEVGLDNNQKSVVDFDSQKYIFKQIVNVCRLYGDKILTIHSRRADNEVINMIGKDFPGKIILHWYSGSIKNLQRALENGYYFSINYSMTQSRNGQKIIGAIPIDRILLETDGPFTQLNEESCWPAHTIEVIRRISKIKNIHQSEDMGDRIFENFKTLIS